MAGRSILVRYGTDVLLWKKRFGVILAPHAHKLPGTNFAAIRQLPKEPCLNGTWVGTMQSRTGSTRMRPADQMHNETC